MATPIQNHRGEPVAACSLSAPAFRATTDHVEALISAVVGTASDISKRLGHPGYTPLDRLLQSRGTTSEERACTIW